MNSGGHLEAVLLNAVQAIRDAQGAGGVSRASQAARQALERLARVAAQALAEAGTDATAPGPDERDPLTGAQTRFVFETRFALAFAEAYRTFHPLGVLRLQVGLAMPPANDGAGLRALWNGFGGLVADFLAPGDTFARLADGEFVVLMPDTSRDRAAAVAEALVSGMRTLPDASPVGLVAGIGIFPDDGLTAERVFDAAARVLEPAGLGG